MNDETPVEPTPAEPSEPAPAESTPVADDPTSVEEDNDVRTGDEEPPTDDGTDPGDDPEAADLPGAHDDVPNVESVEADTTDTYGEGV